MRYPDYSAEYNLGEHRNGETFAERKFVVTNTHGDLSKVEISSYGEILLSSDISTEISITSPSTGEWKILEQKINLPPRSYEIFITFTYASGFKRSYVYGTWTITE